MQNKLVQFKRYLARTMMQRYAIGNPFLPLLPMVCILSACSTKAKPLRCGLLLECMPCQPIVEFMHK